MQSVVNILHWHGACENGGEIVEPGLHGTVSAILEYKVFSEEDEGFFGEAWTILFWKEPVFEEIVCEQESQRG